MHLCSMHVRLSEKHGIGGKLLQISGVRWYIIGHETSEYQNNIKVKICNYLWIKLLGL